MSNISDIKHSLTITYKVSQLPAAIIQVLLYFDIFKHPLKEIEILKYLSIKHDGSIKSELDGLLKSQLINWHNDFYFLGNDQTKITKRLKGNSEANKYLPVATKHSNWLSHIPFIKCICLSGSLSKHYMDDKSDIDYFIITKKNRLWIVRGIFTLIVKSMLVFKSKKYLCTNYIISENNLEIKDRNIFTAIEIATLIPMFNHTTHHDFLMANKWVKDYLPNFIEEPIQALPDKKRRFYKFWEHPLFTHADNLIYKIFKFHYERKFYKPEKTNISLHEFNFNKDLVKIHTMGHRNKILDRYEENLVNYGSKHHIELNPPFFDE